MTPCAFAASSAAVNSIWSSGPTCCAVIPFTAAHGRVSREAFLRFGRGRHPAALNFGDCLTYAVAKLAEMPLLFIGEDFAQTDLVAALD